MNVNVTDANSPSCAAFNRLARHGRWAHNTYDCTVPSVQVGFTNVADVDAIEPVTNTHWTATASAIVSIESVSTAQDYVPRDTASLVGAVAPFDGVLRFEKYKGPGCDSEPRSEETVAENSNGDHNSGNNLTLKQLIANANLTSSTAGTWNWKVSFEPASGSTNQPIVGACGAENFVVTNG